MCSDTMSYLRDPSPSLIIFIRDAVMPTRIPTRMIGIHMSITDRIRVRHGPLVAPISNASLKMLRPLSLSQLPRFMTEDRSLQLPFPKLKMETPLRWTPPESENADVRSGSTVGSWIWEEKEDSRLTRSSDPSMLGLSPVPVLEARPRPGAREVDLRLFPKSVLFMKPWMLERVLILRWNRGASISAPVSQ